MAQSKSPPENRNRPPPKPPAPTDTKAAAPRKTKPRATTRRTFASRAAPAAFAAPAVATGAPPDHFIVFVPGFLGSKLRDRNTKEMVWLDFSSIPRNPFLWNDWLDNLFKRMAYPNPDLEPAGVVEEEPLLPPLFKQEQYGRLLRLFEKWGY